MKGEVLQVARTGRLLISERGVEVSQGVCELSGACDRSNSIGVS